MVIEAKSRLTQTHVKKFLEKLERLKTFFIEYRNHQLYGAMAAIEIDGEVDTYAEIKDYLSLNNRETAYISCDVQLFSDPRFLETTIKILGFFLRETGDLWA